MPLYNRILGQQLGLIRKIDSSKLRPGENRTAGKELNCFLLVGTVYFPLETKYIYIHVLLSNNFFYYSSSQCLKRNMRILCAYNLKKDIYNILH